MTKLIHGIKGMPDILPKDSKAWASFESLWRKLMQLYSYDEIRLPLLEETRLFKRSIGEVTDIVEKEMFTFLDRDEQSITLRPEGTAGCVRACLEGGMLHNQEQRLWYMGPMFRYEKPQMGRYRQFHQVGVEAFGYEGPDIEVEHILLMDRFWDWLKIKNHIELQINTLGSKLSRENYRKAIVDYFSKFKSSLDQDSLRRLDSNPLRILDSKNPDLQKIINDAPRSVDYLEAEDQAHFQALEDSLKRLNVKYIVNPRLVRGLDYYNRTVYEWVTSSLGAQGTLCAGGRYDGLVEQLGGSPTKAVGFALGIERVLMLQQKQEEKEENKTDVYFICVGKEAEIKGQELIEQLRKYSTEYNKNIKFMMHCGGGQIKNQFKRADKSGAEIALILGENELAEKYIGIKFLRGNEAQKKLPLQDEQKLFLFLVEHLAHLQEPSVVG